MKKLMIGLTALAAMGSLALVPSEASARAGGFHGGGAAFHGGFHGFRGGPAFAGGGQWRGYGHRGGYGYGLGAAALGLGLGLAAAGAWDAPYYGYPAYYGGCYLTRQWTPYGLRTVQVCD